MKDRNRISHMPRQPTGRKAGSVILAALVMFGALAATTAHRALASSIYLKNSAVITDSVIRLGDIFGGLDESADAEKVLGVAPYPGREVTLGAHTLLRIAAALDLPWRPSNESSKIVLQRAASIVSEDSMKNAISKRLTDEGTVSGRFDILFTAPANDMILPHEMPATTEVIDISYSPDSDKFQATVASPSAENPVYQRQLTGTIRKIVELPVLKGNLRNGDLIQMSDLDWIDVYASDIQHDYILQADKLAGMTPRRLITAGKPVRDNELESPKLVARGDEVTIVFEQGPLKLTVAGRAIRDGARGDFIRVVNNGSGRTVEGVVTGDRTVTVR